MSPTANDMDAMHRANERAYGDYVFTYTPPDGGDPVNELRGDLRRGPSEGQGGGESETAVRISDYRLGVRTRQLPADVIFEIEGMILGDDGSQFRIIDHEMTDDHAWLFLFSI